MKSFTNNQSLSAAQIREIFGDKTLTGCEGGDIVECNSSLIHDDDVGEIVVRGSYDSFDRSTTAFVEFGGASFVIGDCENTGFDGEVAVYSLIKAK